MLRNAFRAYAYDHTSPAEIMWRLIRHMSDDEMATAICITIDPAVGNEAAIAIGRKRVIAGKCFITILVRVTTAFA